MRASAPQKVLDRGNIVRDGTMPVAARVVGDSLMVTAQALIAMTTECGGAAKRDGIVDLALRPGQRCTFAKPAAGCTDHSSHLKGWPRHLCPSSRVERNVNRSSGLMAACR